MRPYLFIALFFAGCALAGTGNLPTISGGTVVVQHVNAFKQALSGDIVPRDSSGNVGDLNGNMGQASNRWATMVTKKLNIIQDAAGHVASIVSPSALAADETFTLPPVLPSATLPLQLASSGAITTLARAQSASISGTGNSSSSSTSYADIANLTLTVTTSGRSVFLQLIPAPGNNESFLSSPGGGFATHIAFLKDGTIICSQQLDATVANAVNTIPPGAFACVDAAPTAASHTYKVQAKVDGGFLGLNNVALMLYEMAQ